MGENYAKWVAGGPCDQSIAEPEQHSGLVPWDSKNNPEVKDTDLAKAAKPLVNRGVRFIWVFQQCFGGGMFDELNGLGGTQSGISASNFDAPAYYQILRPVGNGVHFATAYLEGMRDVFTRAKAMASVGADNDPWGPANNPNPPRVMGVEMQGLEQPVYFTTGDAADNIDLTTYPGTGVVILWSGEPAYPLDSIEIKQLIYKFVALGYQAKNIYVLYGKGFYSNKNNLVGKAVWDKLGNVQGPKQLRAATKKQLDKVFAELQGRPEVPFVLFFANDHGYNDMMGGVVPQEGGGEYPTDGAPPAYDPYPTDIGQEDN